MPYCPKCGSKISEEMSFCPKCGAALKVEQPSVAEAPPQAPPALPYRAEKGEKREKQEKEEKHEKGEKTEKREKQEHGYIGPLIGGLILILVGFIFYLEITTMIASGVLWAFFFVIIGIIIIIGAIYAASMASRRQPQP
jgi:cation transport ATPase